MERGGSWVAAVALVALALGAAGCGTPATDGGAPPPASSGASASPGTDDGTGEDATSGSVAADQQFTFDQVATFPDGLSVSLGGTEVRQATANETGAQGTAGQLVVVSIVIENSGSAAYDPRSAVITALYGPDGTPATVITDSTAELQTGFAEPVPAGEEGTTAVGFAVPDSGLDELTVIVDLNDDVNEPISFTGRAEKT